MSKAKNVTIEMLTGASGEGWAAPRKGPYECPAKRAKMLIGRGYARPITKDED